MGVIERAERIRSITDSDALPDEIKDILIKMVISTDQLLEKTIGAIELAYRRAKQGEITL